MSTSNTPGISLTKEFCDRFEKLEKYMYEQAEATSKSAPPGTSHRYVPSGSDPGWLSKEEVDRLSKNYDPFFSQQDLKRYLYKGNKLQASGRGNVFKDLAHAATEKWKDPNRTEIYGREQFEREHNWVPENKYFRNEVRDNAGQIVKASNMVSNSGTLGGYVIPPDFRAQLLTIEEEESTILPRCTKVPQTTKTSTYPTLDITTNYGTGKSPYEAGVYQAWQPEAATINQTNAQLNQFNLTNWDLVTYVVISNDLMQDNAVGLDSVITRLFATSAVFYKEYAFQNGLGANSSMPLGITNSPATIAVNRAVSNQIGFSDIITMYAKLQQRSWSKACWHAHQSTIPQLCSIISNATTGQLAFLNPNGEGVDGPLARTMPNKLFGGLDLNFTQTCQQLGTTGDLRLIDWAHYFVAERMGQQVAVSDQFLFTSNQLVFRSVERVGGAPWLQNYITDAQGYTISPYVILQTHV
jgi:HK97 family phage major capsid protein